MVRQEIRRLLRDWKHVEIALAVLGVGITFACGVVGFKVSGIVPIGLWSLYAFLGLAAVLAFSFLLISAQITGVKEQILTSLGERHIASEREQEATLGELIQVAESIHAFVDPRVLLAVLDRLGLTAEFPFDRTDLVCCPVGGGGMPGPARSFRTTRYSPLPAAMPALFVFRATSAAPSDALLLADTIVPSHPYWLRLAGTKSVPQIHDGYVRTHAGDLLLDPAVARDEGWVLRHADRIWKDFAAEWREVGTRAHVGFPSIARANIEMATLAKEADSLHAVDMTDLRAWLVHGRLGRILDYNKAMARTYPGRARRIFIARSTRWLDEPVTPVPGDGGSGPESHRSLLARLLREHEDGGIACGVTYRDVVEERNPNWVRDFAVYGRKVVWFEEGLSDGLKEARGIFSSHERDVEMHLSIFENLWEERFPCAGARPRTPAEEAKAILAGPPGGASADPAGTAIAAPGGRAGA